MVDYFIIDESELAKEGEWIYNKLKSQVDILDKQIVLTGPNIYSDFINKF